MFDKRILTKEDRYKEMMKVKLQMDYKSIKDEWYYFEDDMDEEWCYIEDNLDYYKNKMNKYKRRYYKNKLKV